jgi:K+-transporting ATPase KdpF subunit
VAGFFADSLQARCKDLRRFDGRRRIVRSVYTGSELHGRPCHGGADQRSVSGGMGPVQVLRALVAQGVDVMLWLGLIVTVGLLVYLGVAMFDAENF